MTSKLDFRMSRGSPSSAPVPSGGIDQVVSLPNPFCKDAFNSASWRLQLKAADNRNQGSRLHTAVEAGIAAGRPEAKFLS